MSYYRGYDYGDDNRGYGGGYRSRDDYRDRDRYGGYDRDDRDRRGDRSGGRRDSGYDRRDSGYDRRDSGYDRRDRDSGYDRRDRRDSGGFGGRKGGQGFGGKGRDSGGRSGGQSGGKRSFGDRDRDSSAKKSRKEKGDNWIRSDRHPYTEYHFLDTVPENFEEEWMCIVCPAGKRRILVAANNISQTYDNEGEPDLTFKSCLPNGSPLQSDVMKFQDLTILDTIYCSQTKKIYLLDMVHWKHFPYYDTEAEFRFFFLPEKYSQLKSPLEISENNEYPLVLLDKFKCNNPSIEQALKDTDYKVEGLLFIKKSSTYECTDTVDSRLLRLDQMEKVLGIPLPEGISFVPTSSEDAKWKEELVERKKLRAVREAAKEAQEKEKLEKEKKEREEEEKERLEKEKKEKEKQDGLQPENNATTTGAGYIAAEDYTTGNTVGEEYATGGEYNTTAAGYTTGSGDYATGMDYSTTDYTATAGYTTAGATGGEYATGAEYTSGATFGEGWGQAPAGQVGQAYSTTGQTYSTGYYE